MSSAEFFAVAPSLAGVSGETPVRIPFDNSYARLPERFYARVSPTPVARPRLVKVNHALALQLGLDPQALESAEGVAVLSGNCVAEGSEPLAMAYAGHQFGHFVPQLGDGRANLLGEVVGRDGVRYDLQLKGAGPSVFSRRGDGRAALGPVLREYIVSEAMHALGVPTTRALAAVTTGERVFRDRVLPGAVLTRVAASHLRVGTFQYFAAREDAEALRLLADFAMARHYPEAAQAKRPYLALLEGVIGRHARLVAQWMLLGFVHGVMNTDNTSISGETLDYGPCAFLEAYEPGKVFSSIDQMGRYAYGSQSPAALWNLTRLAEALLPLLAQEAGSEAVALEAAKTALESFEPQWQVAHSAGLRRKLGLFTERAGDSALAEDLLALMAANRADFTLTFRGLSAVAQGRDGHAHAHTLFTDAEAYEAWSMRWFRRLLEEKVPAEERSQSMRGANPAVIPRNHLVEAVIEAAVERDDFTPFADMVEALRRPFEDKPEMDQYTRPARPEQCVTQTFCGT